MIDITNILQDDFEYAITAALLKDITFTLKSFSIIKDQTGIFSKPGVEKIYKATKAYYEKYKILPPQKALDYISGRHPDVREALEEVNQVDAKVLENNQFMMEATQNYVKRGMVKNAVLKSVEIIDEPDKYQILQDMLKEALSVSYDSDLGMNYKDDLDIRLHHARDYSINGIRSGLEKIDDALKVGRGFLPKNIYIVSSKSNLGKSIALCNFASNALLQCKNVLFISLEMQEFFIGQRLDAILTQLKINDIYDVSEEFQLRQKFGLLCKQVGEANIMIKEYPPGSINVHQIRSLINDLKLYKDWSPDIIFIDYLNLLLAGKRGDNRYHDLKHITEEIRALSYEFNAPMVTASQINRGGYDEISPDLETMGESMGIVHTADTIFMLSQTDEERLAGQLIWHIKKNRLGPKDMSFPTVIDYDTLKISDFASLATSQVYTP